MQIAQCQMVRILSLMTATCMTGTFGAQAQSADMAAILADNPDPFAAVDMIAVLGSYGPEGSGVQDLSERRAASVFDWFVANGIEADLITAIGYGETQPIAENETDGADNPEGRARNRRVDIMVTTKRRVNSLPTAAGSIALE